MSRHNVAFIIAAFRGVLAIGLFVKARYESVAESLGPYMSQTSTVAIVLLMVTALVLNYRYMIGLDRHRRHSRCRHLYRGGLHPGLLCGRV
jgi:hypothetical protein